ncbi:hypothetical protein L1049_028536 [Liquidambar formosana]|uniref:FBD domain-containing protein n=1 Tax=Liquidambar formosana TaxID=63359 RepID=A0AAP0RJ12_LIQFO
MSCTLKVFASICLPSLKIFELSYATFSNEIFSKSRQLHFSFLALEVLNVTRCEWLNVKIISIDAPMLKSLKLLSSTFEWELDGSHDCVIKLQVPSLTEFSLRSCGFQEKILLGPFSLSYATIDLSPDVFERNDMREFGLRACMLLNQISNVKQLTLSACTFEGILHWVEDEFVQEMLPQCFQSSLKVIKFEGFSGNEPELVSFKFFLENVMVLEQMIVIAWKWISKPTKKKLKKQLLTYPKGSNCAKIVCCF